MFKFLESMFDSNEKQIKKMQPIIDEINKLEPEFQALTDNELKNKTQEFRSYITDKTVEERKALDDINNEIEVLNEKLKTLESLEAREELSEEIRDAQNSADNAEKKLIEAERKILDELLPRAFAAVREASRRTLGLRHYDVQLIGGIALHHGTIAEMRTGEGKTLVATLALYLNCLSGRGVHLVTVNDYLARRDPYWMGPLYDALGVTVASIYPMQSTDEHTPARLYDPDYTSDDPKNPGPHFRPVKRAEAYMADITYGTSAEFGFDYLRDNMAQDVKQLVQRSLYYAVVDEVDNLLIDEARTPLIISGPDKESSQKYQTFARLVRSLKGRHKTPDEDVQKSMLGTRGDNEDEDVDYVVDEKGGTVEPTNSGYAHVEELLKREGLIQGESLYDLANTDLMRHLRNALNAKELFKKDVEYIVKDGEIVIVDALTGRLMLGRRYSEGLHQAIEAKEGVKVQNESKTYATVTIQNYFRMYSKLSGMTGTAETEAEEFNKIYNLDVLVIPTNKPIQREDLTDYIFVDQKAKYNALLKEIAEIHKTGRPILIGTVSIEKNEEFHKMLEKKGLRHNLLNAKNHLKEAEIIAKAGEKGAITLATNMAGRGVDIILGGKTPEKEEGETDAAFQKRMDEWQKKHDEVISLGGLYVLGTERHEARRIDNQLRGRAGRQGDPGTSRFFVALDDDIMRKFGGERVQGIMERAGFDENSPIENGMISKSIENAQIRVEGYHFDMRKHIVEYDDVINKQREIIYDERRKVLKGFNLRSNVLDMVEQTINDVVKSGFDYEKNEVPSLKSIADRMNNILGKNGTVTEEELAALSNEETIKEYLNKKARDIYAEREKDLPAEVMRIVERQVMIKTIDQLWIDHLTAIDYLRQGIGMSAVAQKDPLVTYKKMAGEMFEELTNGIRETVAENILRINIVINDGTQQNTPPPAQMKAMQSPMKQVMPDTQKVASDFKKAGRNDPCPCGSGKKYKYCHGR